MQNLDLDKEKHPYLNLWILQGNEVEIFWDEDTQSLIRAYVFEDLYWKSDAEVQSLDQALKTLNEHLGDTVFAEVEDFTEDWKHND